MNRARSVITVLAAALLVGALIAIPRDDAPSAKRRTDRLRLGGDRAVMADEQGLMDQPRLERAAAAAGGQPSLQPPPAL
jgi:hypothetical protein